MYVCMYVCTIDTRMNRPDRLSCRAAALLYWSSGPSRTRWGLALSISSSEGLDYLLHHDPTVWTRHGGGGVSSPRPDDDDDDDDGDGRAVVWA
jgi:hypothetical protein